MRSATGIDRVRHAVLAAGAVMLVGANLALAIHLTTEDHCPLEGPDHQCDLCRHVEGNPSFTAPPPAVPPAVATAHVAPVPMPGPRPAAHPIRPGRAPPVTVRVT